MVVAQSRELRRGHDAFLVDQDDMGWVLARRAVGRELEGRLGLIVEGFQQLPLPQGFERLRPRRIERRKVEIVPVKKCVSSLALDGARPKCSGRAYDRDAGTGNARDARAVIGIDNFAKRGGCGERTDDRQEMQLVVDPQKAQRGK